MRVEANCTLRWHEHDLDARVAGDVEDVGPGAYRLGELDPEVLQHDGPSSVDGVDLMANHVNLMNAMEALIQAYEKAVKT